MQTSVSQRPLTAKRRPHMRTADYDQSGLSSRHGWATDRIPARRLSSNTPNLPSGQVGACSVAPFRTAANRGQQPSQVLDCRHNGGGERSGQCDAAAASSSSQVMMPWGSGADNSSSSTARQQPQDCNPAQPTPRGATQGYWPTPLTAGQEPAAPCRALPDAYTVQADGPGYGGSRGVTRRYSMPEQPSASSIMHVKPPWAVDDPYQVSKAVLFGGSTYTDCLLLRCACVLSACQSRQQTTLLDLLPCYRVFGQEWAGSTCLSGL